MRKVIITRLLPTTTHKGTRIKAKIVGKEIIRSYDYGLSSNQNHVKVAHELARLLGWKVKLIAGSIDNTSDCAHIIYRDCETWEEVDNYLEIYLEKV